MLSGLYQDAVVPQRQTVLETVRHAGRIAGRAQAGRVRLRLIAGFRARKVVVDRKKSVLEVFEVQVDVFEDGGAWIQRERRGKAMTLAPDPHRPDVDECDVGVAVIAAAGGGYEAFKLLEKDWIVEVRLPYAALRHQPAVLRERPLGAGLPDPFWCRVHLSGLAGGETQGNVLALGDPPLRGCIHNRPVELPLLGFEVRPRQPEIDHRQAGEVIDGVRGCEP
jgi:hypothetical protein